MLSIWRVERSTLGLTVITNCCVVASARNRATSFFGRRGDRSFGPGVRHIDHYRLEAVVPLDSQTFSIIFLSFLSFLLQSHPQSSHTLVGISTWLGYSGCIIL